MNITVIWDKVLDSLKSQLSSVSYETWFSDTKLLNINDGIAKVLVPSHVHKKHLKENYNDFVENVFSVITGTNFNIEYVLEEEIIHNIEINTDDYGVPNKKIHLETNLKPEYTFDTFIVGQSNRFAHSTALAVAESPGNMYNPLFIYGSSGLGKTHLMHAIGNYIIKNSNRTVLYVTSEKFISDFTGITKRDKDGTNFDNVNEFKSKYRDIDVLIIDDIQYLGNATKTQQEFFNTFNELHGNNKQIIISSDRSPDDLKLLEDRLRTRFNWGLTVDILPPDFNLRMAIINKKIEGNHLIRQMDEKVKEYIASNCTSDVRKLEGAITRVYAYATMMGEHDINLELAEEALRDHFGKTIISKNNIQKIQHVVADHYNITVDDMKSKKRSANIALPRQVAMYICRVLIEESFPRIGIEFGGKDHTTVIHSVEKIKKEINKNPDLESEINKLMGKIK